MKNIIPGYNINLIKFKTIINILNIYNEFIEGSKKYTIISVCEIRN